MTNPLPVADGRRTRRVLGRLVRAQGWRFSLAILAVLVSTMLAVASPFVLGDIVDAASAVGAVYAQIVPLLVVLGAVVVAQAVAAAWARIAVSRAGERMLAALRSEVVERILRLPTRRVEAAGRGDVVARITGDVAIVGEAVSTVIPTAGGAAFMIAASLAGLSLLDPRLALAALLAVPIQIVALRLHLRRSQPVYRDSRAAAGERSQLIMEALDARATLTAYGATPVMEARIDTAARRTARLSMAAARLGVRFWGRLNMAEFVGLAAILAVGWLLVATGAGTVGAATAAALLFMQLFGPIGAVLAGFDDLQRAGASLARLVGILDEPAAEPSVVWRGERRDATVQVEDAHAAYGARVVLRGVHLSLRAGGHVAVVGASGAGKSTLAAVIAGDVPLESGRISFSDPEPRVGVVAQEPHVFTGMLRDDLRLARPDAGDQALASALAAVGAEWTRDLADGLDTVVGAGGVTLTDAQQQQLALARMHLFDPEVLILDEATSEARGAAAHVLGRAIEELATGRTTVTIAHRLEQAARADAVIVMDEGSVVERGTHSELVAADGAYARLWRSYTSP